MGAEILTYPSAFTVKTGAAHWDLLGRARAIDSQSYVIMPGQKGVHDVSIEDDDASDPTKVVKCQAVNANEQKRISYGHSIIIDPWGTVVAEASDINLNNDEPEIIVADIDLDNVKKIRRDMPLKDHRRREIFNN